MKQEQLLRVTGYTDKIAAIADEEITFFVHSEFDGFTGRLDIDCFVRHNQDTLIRQGDSHIGEHAVGFFEDDVGDGSDVYIFNINNSVINEIPC